MVLCFDYKILFVITNLFLLFVGELWISLDFSLGGTHYIDEIRYFNIFSLEL